jgi:DNA-binding FadR family transcriptional regulator
LSDKQIETTEFQPVTRQRLADAVVDQLQARIASGDLAAGSRLPSERELGDAFGVARTTVREAVRALEASGSLVRRGRWLFIAAPDALPDAVRLLAASLTVHELFETRRLLQVRIAEVAADQAKRSDLLRLPALLDDLDAADEASFAVADRAFQDAIATASQHGGLIELYEQGSRMFFDVPALWRGGRGPAPRARWHHELYRAIQARRSDAAGAAMFHLLESQERELGAPAAAGEVVLPIG